MEEQEDGWLTLLEKNGLGPAASILENYGIDSETDFLVLEYRRFISRDRSTGQKGQDHTDSRTREMHTFRNH